MLASSWKLFLGAGLLAGGLAVGSIGYLLHETSIAALKEMHRQEVATAQRLEREQCDKDKAITKGVADGLHRKISNLHTDIANVRVRERTACIAIAPDATAANDGTAETGKPAGAHAISAGFLIDFAGEAEQYRLQLLACQDFITKTWESR